MSVGSISPPRSSPEDGISIAREGAAAEALYARMERPARLGRIAMGVLGAVTTAAGIAAWAIHDRLVGLALAAFGGVLIVLALIQHILLRRDDRHWATEVVLRTDGVEIFLRNGDGRGMSWTDSDFALNLVSRAAPAPENREYLLVWMPDPRIPSIELSAEGYDLLKQAVENQRLLVSPHRRGRKESATVWTEIRQGGPGSFGSPAPSSKTLPRDE